ncbi:hypothetical protein R1flu_004678 [Riccia fluitans]|uniref:Uncharacterized protein n=1 Tax=Riccia fluitans TaxID=41844 RepID=A0ABD1YQZ2_9MARC
MGNRRSIQERKDKKSTKSTLKPPTGHRKEAESNKGVECVNEKIVTLNGLGMLEDDSSNNDNTDIELQQKLQTLLHDRRSPTLLIPLISLTCLLFAARVK